MVNPVTRPPTLTQTVADAIKQAIFLGDFQPGDPLREIDLKETLQVSRSTIREALRYLQEDGLVRIVPHHGASVTRMTRKAVREVYTMRTLLEPFAVRLAMEADAYSKDALKRLSVLAERLGELEAYEGSDFETVEANIQFHDAICRPSNHDILLETLNRLQSLTWMFLLSARHAKLYLSEEYLGGPSHSEILDSIKSKNINLAEDRLRRHIAGGGEAFLAYLDRENDHR